MFVHFKIIDEPLERQRTTANKNFDDERPTRMLATQMYEATHECMHGSTQHTTTKKYYQNVRALRAYVSMYVHTDESLRFDSFNRLTLVYNP